MKVRVEVKVFLGSPSRLLDGSKLVNTNKQQIPVHCQLPRWDDQTSCSNQESKSQKPERVQPGEMEAEKSTLSRLRIQFNKLKKEEEDVKINLETIRSEESEISGQKSIALQRISLLDEIISECQRGKDEYEDKIRRGNRRKS